MIEKKRIRKEKTAIIIAAYNEEQHIRGVVQAVHAEGFPFVVVVSDGSADATVKEAKAANAIVLEHITNLGKGGALKTGSEYAVTHGAEALVFLDGDGQHEPTDLPRFLKELETHEIAFGARQRTKKMPFVLRFGNWFISELIYQLYGMNLHDSQCGFRALRAEVYPKVVWRSLDYSVESEIITWAGKANLSYAEVPIRTIYHDRYKGTTPLDGFPIVWNLLMWRFHKREGRIKKLLNFLGLRRNYSWQHWGDI